MLDRKAIVAAYDAGLTMRTIARKHACTPQRIGQIVRMMGSERNVYPQKRALNIKVKTRYRWTDAELAEIKLVYTQTSIPCEAICAFYRIGATYLKKLAHEQEWPLRPRGRRASQDTTFCHNVEKTRQDEHVPA